MATAKGKVPIGSEVTLALKGELDKRAKAEGRSKSEVIARAVRFYLDHAKLVRADEADRPEPKAGAVV